MSTAVDDFMSASLRRSRKFGELMDAPHPADHEVRTVTYTSRNQHTLFKSVVRVSHGSLHVLTTEKAVRKHVPRLAPRLMAAGDEHVTFNDVLKHSRCHEVATDPREAPRGNYVFVTDSRSHRGLFTREAVLTNLLLNFRANGNS